MSGLSCSHSLSGHCGPFWQLVVRQVLVCSMPCRQPNSSPSRAPTPSASSLERVGLCMHALESRVCADASADCRYAPAWPT